MRLLMLDNYDSFTYNLVHLFEDLGAEVPVARNDQITLDEIERLAPEKIVISPGPGRPKDAGISVAVVQRFAKQIPILGVCLGHQAIAAAYGAKVVESDVPVHGKVFSIQHDGKTIFRGIRSPLKATRYHSLVVPRKGFPRQLTVSAFVTPESAPRERIVKGLRHRKLPIEGVQFHPESILTVDGKKLLANFLKLGTPTRLHPGKARVFDAQEALNQPPPPPPKKKAPRKKRAATTSRTRKARKSK